MSGPLRVVLDAFEDGATSLADVSRRTGLSRDTVEASIEHLVRLGRIDARQMTQGCPSGGCGGCASGGPDGSAGCGASRPGPQRNGPVLVALSLRRPGAPGDRRDTAARR